MACWRAWLACATCWAWSFWWLVRVCVALVRKLPPGGLCRSLTLGTAFFAAENASPWLVTPVAFAPPAAPAAPE